MRRSLLALAASMLLAPGVPAQDEAQDEEELFGAAETLFREIDRFAPELGRIRKELLARLEDPVRTAPLEQDRQAVRQRLSSLAARSDDLHARFKSLHQTRWAEMILMIKDDRGASNAGRPTLDRLRRLEETRSRLHSWRDRALQALREDEEVLGARRKELEDRKLRAQRLAHARGKKIQMALFFGVLGVCLLALLVLAPRLRSGQSP